MYSEKNSSVGVAARAAGGRIAADEAAMRTVAARRARGRWGGGAGRGGAGGRNGGSCGASPGGGRLRLLGAPACPIVPFDVVRKSCELVNGAYQSAARTAGARPSRRVARRP